MKYAFSLIVGIVLGVIAAVALVYVNPLTRGQSAPIDDPQWVLEYKLAARDNWLSTHDKRLDIPVVPIDAPLLWEHCIRGSLLSAMPLKCSSGAEVAAATRISVPSPESEFLRAGLLVEDYWLISVPGEGTVFLHALSNQWPLLRDTVVRVDWLRRNWSGPGEYDLTQGPVDTRAVVIGLTGIHKGSSGHGHDRLSLESYDGSLAPLTGQLTIEMGDTPG